MAKRGRKQKYKFSTNTVMEGWANKFPEVTVWLAKLQQRSFRAYTLFLFCDWAEITPTELLALKEDRNSLKAEHLLDKFVAKKPYPQTLTWNATMSVRSFFRKHYRNLEPAAGQMYLEKVKPYNKPTKEGLQKIWKAAGNPRDRALVSFVNSTAIARETLVNLKWSHLEDDWENVDIPHIGIDDKLLKGHGIGKWKGVEQHTFLTPEAKEDLIDYREWWQRRSGIKFTKDMNIFWTVKKTYVPLSYVDLTTVQRSLEHRSGVKFGWHDARRYVQTACEEARINPNWMKKIKGRKVRGEESPYSRPAIEQLREAFEKAIPFLLFRTARLLNEEQRRKQSIMDMIRIQFKDQPNKIAKMENLLVKAKTMSEIDATLHKVTGNEIDEEDCQKIVDEKELPKYLDKGWRVVSALPSGKVVIESNNNH